MSKEKTAATKANRTKANSYTLSGADVFVNAPESPAALVTYPQCSTTINRYDNTVVVTPSLRHYERNTRVCEFGRIKVMTRKDGTYMLYFQIVPEVDFRDFDARMDELGAALSLTIDFDERRGQ